MGVPPGRPGSLIPARAVRFKSVLGLGCGAARGGQEGPTDSAEGRGGGSLCRPPARLHEKLLSWERGEQILTVTGEQHTWVSVTALGTGGGRDARSGGVPGPGRGARMWWGCPDPAGHSRCKSADSWAGVCVPPPREHHPAPRTHTPLHTHSHPRVHVHATRPRRAPSPTALHACAHTHRSHLHTHTHACMQSRLRAYTFTATHIHIPPCIHTSCAHRAPHIYTELTVGPGNHRPALLGQDSPFCPQSPAPGREPQATRSRAHTSRVPLATVGSEQLEPLTDWLFS